MPDIIVELGASVFSNIIQLIAGSILSIPVYILASKSGRLKSGFINDLIPILLFSISGAVLPLNIYGIIPICLALVAAGLRYYTILPFVVSNAVFNMLVPFNDVGFVWSNGIYRVIAAILIAAAAGIILKVLKFNKDVLIRPNSIFAAFTKPFGIRSIPVIIIKNMNLAGIYLLTGVIADTVFHKYIWWDLMRLLTQSRYLSFIPGFFSQYNVTNPFFLLSMTIIFTLLDLVKMSALPLIFKLRGMAIYYVYLAVWSVLLGLSAFI